MMVVEGSSSGEGNNDDYYCSGSSLPGDIIIGRRRVQPSVRYRSESPVRLTVWCRSLLFNGRGYTVYDDSDGRIIFRVDNYAHNWRHEMALMDRAGNVVLTVRRSRKILSLVESWKVYKGDADVSGGLDGESILPLLKATKDLGSSSCTISMKLKDGVDASVYRMSWSRQKESSKIYRTESIDTSVVAEVNRKFGGSKKTLLDKDVLTMMVQPGMDHAIAVAMIMITNSMR